MAEAINIHKQLAMGKSPEVRNSAKGSIPKYAAGGSVKVPPALDSSRKEPLPRPPAGMAGKIATLKKGGAVPKKGLGVTIAVAIPVKKSAGRGR